MTKEAVSAGYYRSEGWGQGFPKIQVLTIADLLRGAEIKMPPAYGTFKEAQKVKAQGQQLGFDLEA
ncbi:MAG: hypothetical protein ABIQ44_01230 [Chloroflexia bacterium]